jgi:hypothetical protein
MRQPEICIGASPGEKAAELAGKPSHQIQLGGQRWASWQTSRSAPPLSSDLPRKDPAPIKRTGEETSTRAQDGSTTAGLR